MVPDFEKIIKDLNDTLTVVANIQQRQAEVLKGHSAWLEEHDRWMAGNERRMKEREEFEHRFSERMLEIQDKLDGLIGFMDNQFRKDQ